MSEEPSREWTEAGVNHLIVGTDDKWTWLLLMGPDMEINLTPAQAREVAAHLIACAATAEGENHD